MPGLARKVLICAAVDGLILQPLNSKRDQRSFQPIVVRYGDGLVSAVPRDAVPDLSRPNSSFEAFGIVGLISVFQYNYLVSITRRQLVAQIRGTPVYVVTEVALTPCSSQQDAGQAIARTAKLLTRGNIDHDATNGIEGLSDDEEDGSVTSAPSDDEVGDYHDGQGSDRSNANSTVAEDVIGRRGRYGRFAQRWFSGSGWAMGQKRIMGLSTGQAIDQTTGADGLANTTVPKRVLGDDDTAASDAATKLFPKFLKTTQTFFGSSRSFYFSYDHDLTRSMNNPKVPQTPLVPLHNHADTEFFWNRNIMQPFIEAGLDSVALPLIQGFVGQRTFMADSHRPQMSEKPFDMTVISRRSTKRAGLRYLRRGVDEEGHVANAVESEQMLSPSDAAWDPSAKVYSFTQIRGSIPLFFSQTPFSLKPAPVMEYSTDANLAAMEKHFERLRKRYGRLQIVNLVEGSGVEAPLGEEYLKTVQRLNMGAGSDQETVSFEWFDFHAACRGMKFENVSFLLQTLGSKVESLGKTVSVNGEVISRQSGVIRTNCMDCLDRTNICQSSFAGYMLDLQLKEQGYDVAGQRDVENSWFNTLWADNGDAISKQYASTNAMKGDYTRTKKRNYRGALMDARLSLTRLFNGMFNDFFLQATIDFLLGNVTSLVFEEFESNMMTQDPAVSMQRMRESAIEFCRTHVVADESEEFIGGWTMLTPVITDTIRGQPFEEAILLLTDSALYLCRFEWKLDKVCSFERVDLAHVQKIRFGTYITWPFSAAQTDEVRNVGLLIEYRPGRSNISRVNTGSFSVPVGSPQSLPGKGQQAKSSGGSGTVDLSGFLARNSKSPPESTRRIALKALQSQTSLASPRAGDGDHAGGAKTRLAEIQQVVIIASEIERLAVARQPGLAGKETEKVSLIEKGDIVSLAEAKRNVGVLEQLGHSLKKLVWA